MAARGQLAVLLFGVLLVSCSRIPAASAKKHDAPPESDTPPDNPTGPPGNPSGPPGDPSGPPDASSGPPSGPPKDGGEAGSPNAGSPAGSTGGGDTNSVSGLLAALTANADCVDWEVFSVTQTEVQYDGIGKYNDVFINRLDGCNKFDYDGFCSRVKADSSVSSGLETCRIPNGNSDYSGTFQNALWRTKNTSPKGSVNVDSLVSGCDSKSANLLDFVSCVSDKNPNYGLISATTSAGEATVKTAGSVSGLVKQDTSVTTTEGGQQVTKTFTWRILLP